MRLGSAFVLAALAAVASAAPRAAATACPAGEVGYRSPEAVSHYLEARLAGLRGDHEREAEELRLALAYDDGNAELLAAHAEALAAVGRIDAADAAARRALTCQGDGRAAASAHLLLGRILAARHQVQPALAELRAAMAIEAARAAGGERGDPEAWRLAADLQVEASDLDGASATLEAAVAAIGSDGGGFRELGRTLLERHETARAERPLRRAIELDRGDLEGWRMLARVDEVLHNKAEARVDWTALLRLDPENADALLGLGRLALLDDDLAAGEEWFRRHLRAAGDGPEPRLRVAIEWLEARRPEEALRLAREGLAAAPGDSRLRLVAGLALQELRRWRESAAVLGEVTPGAGELWFTARATMAYDLARAGLYEEALAALAPPMAARPGEPRLVTLQAGVLIRTGRADEAVGLLAELRADRARLGDQAALLELDQALADALVRSGRADDAVAGLRSAVETRPSEPALRYALGAALASAGRPDEGVEQMRAMLALDPENAEALNFIGYRYAEQGVRLDEAEALLRRALQAAPRSGHIVDSLGWLMLRKGNVPRAVELLEQATRLVGPDPAVLEHLGDAYRAAGRTSDATAAYRRALGSFGDEPPAEQLRLRASLERKLSSVAASTIKPVAR
jgi:tetratricopeptide (TPR) repeat protein